MRYIPIPIYLYQIGGLDMSKRWRGVFIYAPAHFRATWKKFLDILEREGKTGSQEIRIWVEGYVRRKDPGNPQRPLTAWVPGHEDELALQFQEIIDKLHKIASRRQGELTYWMIINELKPHVQGAALVRAAERVARELAAQGVKVYR